MNHDFDPYDMLLQITERINLIERQHNKLAKAYQLSQRDLDTALKSIQHLQQIILRMRTPNQ